MNREQLRNRVSGRIEKFRLDDGAEVNIRPLSALDRAKLLDAYRELKPADGKDPLLEDVIKTQYFIASRSLVDDSGALLYGPDELDAMSDELDWKSMDAIAARVIKISGMSAEDDAGKNSQPTLSDGSSSA